MGCPHTHKRNKLKETLSDFIEIYIYILIGHECCDYRDSQLRIFYYYLFIGNCGALLNWGSCRGEGTLKNAKRNSLHVWIETVQAMSQSQSTCTYREYHLRAYG